MADFINTIDALGDDAVFDSIINRTITEFKDDKITKVRKFAFAGCADLENVELPECTAIGEKAFEGCTSLNAITPETFPKVKNIPAGNNYMFSTSGIKTLEWPVLEQFKSLYGFKECTALVSADMANLTTANSHLFSGCKALTSVNLPKLTVLPDSALTKCESLKSVTLPSVTAFDGYSCFAECKTLEQVDLPLCASIPEGKHFRYCYALTALILRNTGTVCTLNNVDSFTQTPIEEGTGYIYVPSALIESYKTAANWSTFANQFRKLEEWTVDGTVTGAFDSNRHMVRFFNDDGSLLGYKIVTTGSDAAYDGTPVCSEDSSWEFKGFEPAPTNVTADIDCYAQYEEPITLETASWARISEISAAGEGENYFAIGDTKTLQIVGTMGTVSLNTTKTARIIGFNHNSDREGTGIHFAFTYSFGDSTYNYASGPSDGTKAFNMNHWGSNNDGGWKGCDARYDILGSTDVKPSGYGSKAVAGRVGYDATSTCATNPVANTLMSCLPAELRAVMKPITKYTDNVGGKQTSSIEANVTASIDYLPLMAIREVAKADCTDQNTYEINYQQRYAYYATLTDIGQSNYYWCRSPIRTYGTSFGSITNKGYIGSTSSYARINMNPVFMV